ncbi:MAG: hypothetical protein P8Y71_28205 [Pseudolabrys sp.]|jgi:hypothetical protein
MNVLARPLPDPPPQAGEGAGSAGRLCPADCAYPPSVLARAPDLAADVLYVVGGLYGNLAALQAVERLAAAELSPPRIVFNGDFHWFDAEPDWFAAVERGVAPHAALRGNVESEIARAQDVGAGCGCAYPPSVDDGVVERSNEILTQLRAQAPDVARARLGQLPMHLVAAVGSLRVGIVHGDAASLAGWRFAHDALDKAANRRWLDAARSDSNIDVFACTHTCLACLRDYALDAGRLTVINNGAAGMPNFTGSRFGVVTRIAASPSPHEPLYGLERDRVHMDALTLDYDHEAFLARFLARWPQGSAAHQSYFWRMVAGPDYMLAQAAPQ